VGIRSKFTYVGYGELKLDALCVFGGKISLFVCFKLKKVLVLPVC